MAERRAGLAQPAWTAKRRDRLIENERPALWRYARALAPDAATAARWTERAVSAARAAWERRPDESGGGETAARALRLWLFALLRAEATAGGAPGRDWTPIAVDEAAAAGTVDPETLRRTAAALAAMPPEAREALALVAVEGFRYDEAAALLETSPAAVEARLNRARAALRGGEAGR